MTFKRSVVFILCCCFAAGSQNSVSNQQRDCGGPDGDCVDSASGLMQKILETHRHKMALVEESAATAEAVQRRELAGVFHAIAHLHRGGKRVGSHAPEVLKHVKSLVQSVMDGPSAAESHTDIRLAMQDIVDLMWEIISDTATTYNEDQREVNRLRDAVVSCKTIATGHMSTVAQRKTYVDSKNTAHNQCRRKQRDEIGEQVETCNDFKNYATNLRPPDCASQFPGPDRLADRLTCIQAMATWAHTANRTYIAKKAACDEDKRTRVSTAANCDTAQVMLEMAFCQYADKLETSCDDQTTCRNQSVSARAQALPEIRTSEAGRKVEFKSAKNVICLVGVLNASHSQMPTSFQECIRSYDTVNVDNYTINYPDIPGPVACDKSPVAAKTCDSAWQQTYYVSQTDWYDYSETDLLTGQKLIVAPLACTPCAGDNHSSAPTYVSPMAAPRVVRADASLWVRASDLHAGQVLAWNNKGASEVTHKLSTVGLSGGQRPLAMKENGIPFVRFDGIDDQFDDANLQSADNSLNIFIRMRSRGRAQYYNVFDGNDGAMCLWVASGNNFELDNCGGQQYDTIYSASKVAPTGQRGEWMTVHAGVNSGKAEFRINGEYDTRAGSTNPTNFGDHLEANYAYHWFNRQQKETFDGDVAEIVVVSRAITAAERQEINNYLASMTPAGPTPAPTPQVATPAPTPPTTPATSLQWYDNTASGWDTSSTYADGVQFCSAQGLGLCTFDEICPDGKVVGGTKSGDKWVPYAGDGDNAWVQVGVWRGGSESATCVTHHTMAAHRFRPPWGTQRTDMSVKEFLPCCGEAGGQCKTFDFSTQSECYPKGTCSDCSFDFIDNGDGTRDFGNWQCPSFTRFYAEQQIEWSDLPTGYRFKCDHRDNVHLGLQSVRDDRDYSKRTWNEGATWKFNIECQTGGTLYSYQHSLGDAASECEDRVIWVKEDGNVDIYCQGELKKANLANFGQSEFPIDFTMATWNQDGGWIRNLGYATTVKGDCVSEAPQPTPAPTRAPVGCADEGMAHGDRIESLWYQAESVNAPAECQSETRARVCNDGVVTFGNGAYTHSQCVVKARCQDPDLGHGETDKRFTYAAERVNAPATCRVQRQTRTCNDGVFSSWSGSNTFVDCVVKARCSNPDKANGETESRVRYAAREVNAPGTCTDETQERTCQNGNFSAWSGSYSDAACVVKARCAAADLDHNESDSRDMYEADSVNAPAACNKEEQTRSCDDGTLSKWSGSFTHVDCHVQARCTDPDNGHGETDTRTMYQAESVTAPATCASETQTRTCNDGTYSGYSSPGGDFTHTTCDVQAATPAPTPASQTVSSYTWDFEDGTLQGFEVLSGDCGSQPVRYDLAKDSRWNANKAPGAGNYYVNTYLKNNVQTDAPMCEYGDKEHRFVVGSETVIEWWYTAESNSVYLMEYESDVVLKQFNGNYASFTAKKVTWQASDLTAALGKTCYLKFSDHGPGGWDHIQIDNIKVTGAVATTPQAGGACETFDFDTQSECYPKGTCSDCSFDFIDNGDGTRDFGNWQCPSFTRFYAKKKIEFGDLPTGYRFKCEHKDNVHLGLQSVRDDRDYSKKTWNEGATWKFNIECQAGGTLHSFEHSLGDAASACEDRVIWVKEDGNVDIYCQGELKKADVAKFEQSEFPIDFTMATWNQDGGWIRNLGYATTVKGDCPVVTEAASPAGLQMWFDATDDGTIDKNADGRVTKWSDKSDNGRHLTAPKVNRAPTKGTDTINFGDGSKTQWLKNTQVTGLKTPLHIIMKVDLNSGTHGDSGYIFDGPGDQFTIYKRGTNLELYQWGVSVAVPTSLYDGSKHIIEAVFAGSGGKNKIAFDGAEWDPNTGAGKARDLTTVTLGEDGFTREAYGLKNLKIEQFLMYDHELSATDRQAAIAFANKAFQAPPTDSDCLGGSTVDHLGKKWCKVAIIEKTGHDHIKPAGNANKLSDTAINAICKSHGESCLGWFVCNGVNGYVEIDSRGFHSDDARASGGCTGSCPHGNTAKTQYMCSTSLSGFSDDSHPSTAHRVIDCQGIGGGVGTFQYYHSSYAGGCYANGAWSGGAFYVEAAASEA